MVEEILEKRLCLDCNHYLFIDTVFNEVLDDCKIKSDDFKKGGGLTACKLWQKRKNEGDE